MRKALCTIILTFYVLSVIAQGFKFRLTGDPVDTVGWVCGPQSSVDGADFVLTRPVGNQAGYIYYRTPQNLTSCAQFSVSFEFKITNSSNPTADGITFWYISNPPTGFTLGAGIGLPNNPNGLLLILDSYNNDAVVDNPLVSLRRLDGTSNYQEGSPTGQLAPDLKDQKFITDGNWHTCLLVYDFGKVTVSFDGNPPVMTGNATLNLNGYFGFSSGTGSAWARHAIRNVLVQGAPEPMPPVGEDQVYCAGETPRALTASGSNLRWFSSATGGNPLPQAPTPATDVPGTYYWYVSQEVLHCSLESTRDTVVVTVHPRPQPPLIDVPQYCSGQEPAALTVPPGRKVLWYETETGGIGNSSAPVISTDRPDTFRWYVTQISEAGCESDRVAVAVGVAQSPILDFNYEWGYGCGQDTVHFNNLSAYSGNYLWNFGDDLTDTVRHPSHVYHQQGRYTVTLNAGNAFCSQSLTRFLDVHHPLEALFTTPDSIVCEGAEVPFLNQSTGLTFNNIAPTYSWDFGDGQASEVQHPVHQFKHPGVYKVRLVVTDFVPCRDTAYYLIRVDSLPRLSIIWNDTSVCAGVPVKFKGKYSREGLQRAAWNFGDGPDLVNDQDTMTHAYDRPGTYKVSLAGLYRVCSGLSDSITVRVKPLPQLQLSGDAALCLQGQALVLSDEINKGNARATWLWSTGATTSSLEVRHPGIYKGSVTIDQCTTTDIVYVGKDCYVDIPNAFTPNGDGVNDYFFPRQFLSRGGQGLTIVVYNRWGQKVFESHELKGRGWDGCFNGKEQAEGVYIYEIRLLLYPGKTETYRGNVTLIR